MKINSILQNNVNFKSNQTHSVKNLINENRMVDHFIKIAKIDSGSDPVQVGIKSPTTKGQLDLAEALAEELKEIGLKEIEIDEYGILTATLPSNVEDTPTIAFLAHMDTSPDVKNTNVQPIIHDYKNGDIKLKNNEIIKEKELQKYQGHKIITSDGTTLLGADDKAGISEIIEALKVFSENPQLKRPTIKVAFTPDEEGCDGIKNFDVKKFNADVAYTVDGEDPECVDTENFNAFSPIITIKGVDVHPGFAYKKMVNSIDIANKFINMLPKNETPATTKGKQGYCFVNKVEGSVEETKLNVIIRDFDYEKAKERVQFVRSLLEKLKEKYPQIEFSMNPNERYQNMKNELSKNPKIIENAMLGIKKTGLTPKENSIRGGTDGSDLTLMGLPCPNLGAGGKNFHSLNEFVSVNVMKQCCENIINIAQIWAEK